MACPPDAINTGYQIVDGVFDKPETSDLLRSLEVVERKSPVDCLVAAGRIVAMRPLILHASSKVESTRPRRVLHIEYGESLDIGDGLRIAIA